MTRPVGLVVPNNEPGAAQALQWLPEHVEQLGYRSVWVTDHVVGVRAMAGVYGDYWLEALTTLTWLAARTQSIRIGTGILVLPHRNPVLTAKIIATVDALSGGRVDLGVGTGWSRTEFANLGVGALFADRGRVTDEVIEVLLACWRGGDVEHVGDHFSVEHIRFEPTPVQQPHPPIWVGGDSPRALRRAARFADVWHPHDVPVARFVELADALDAAAGRPVGRSVRVAVDADGIDAIVDTVDSYVAAGCSHVVLDFRSLPCDAVVELAERAATQLFA